MERDGALNEVFDAICNQLPDQMSNFLLCKLKSEGVFPTKCNPITSNNGGSRWLRQSVVVIIDILDEV